MAIHSNEGTGQPSELKDAASKCLAVLEVHGSFWIVTMHAPMIL